MLAVVVEMPVPAGRLTPAEDCTVSHERPRCVSLIHGPVEMSEGMSRDAVEDLQLPVSIAYNTYQSVRSKCQA